MEFGHGSYARVTRKWKRVEYKPLLLHVSRLLHHAPSVEERRNRRGEATSRSQLTFETPDREEKRPRERRRRRLIRYRDLLKI